MRRRPTRSRCAKNTFATTSCRHRPPSRRPWRSMVGGSASDRRRRCRPHRVRRPVRPRPVPSAVPADRGLGPALLQGSGPPASHLGAAGHPAGLPVSAEVVLPAQAGGRSQHLRQRHLLGDDADHAFDRQPARRVRHSHRHSRTRRSTRSSPSRSSGSKSCWAGSLDTSASPLSSWSGFRSSACCCCGPANRRKKRKYESYKARVPFTANWNS